MKDQSKRIALSTKLIWLLVVFVFLVMLLFNMLTPFLSDDYSFAFSFKDKTPIHGFMDAFESQQYHYMTWSGRFIIKLLAQWFTSMPKIIFNFLNAAVFTGLGYMLYKLALGRRKGASPVLLVFSFLGLWLFSPVFGQTNLWMCGSFNYLWATFFCITAMLPFGLYMQKPFTSPKWFVFVTFFAGIIAGWSSENTSAGLLVALVLFVAFELFYAHRVPVWMWGGLGGALIGFALLVLAPGNYMRHDTAPDPRSPLTILTVRFLNALDLLWQHGLILLIMFAVLYALLVMQKPGIHKLFWPLVPFFAALGANFAMVLSPVYYERSTHGVLTYLLLACLVCLTQLKLPNVRNILVCAAAGLSMAVAFQLVWAGYDILSFSMMHHNREAFILQQKAVGSMDVVTYSIEPYTRWCGAYGLPDLRDNPEEWLSWETARYYGLNSVTASETRTYPFPGRSNSVISVSQADAPID